MSEESKTEKTEIVKESTEKTEIVKESTEETKIVKEPTKKTEVVQEYFVLSCGRPLKDMYNHSFYIDGTWVGALHNEFRELVNDNLKDGWKCTGGVTVLKYDETENGKITKWIKMMQAVVRDKK